MAGCLVVLIACALFLTACGSHGSSDIDSGGTPSSEDTSTAVASGTIVFPSGFALQPSILTVNSASGSVAVGSNGSYTVTEPAGGGAATVMLTDANGNIIMLGHVDTSNPKFNDISPHSTAVELLFLATASFNLPRTVWSNVYTIIEAAPETTTLADVISTRMAANPTAIEDMDPVIISAIDAAAASLMAGMKSQSSADAAVQSGNAYSPTPITMQTKAAAAATGSLTVKTAPSETTPIPAWGVIASPSDDHLGFIVTNQSRINRYYLVYRTGYIPSTGNITDKPTSRSPWELVGSGLVPAVSGATGFANTLVDFYYAHTGDQKSTWSPVDTPTITLPTYSADDVLANTYQAYVVGMGYNYVPNPSDANAAAKIQLSQQEMVLYQATKEFLWPILTKVIPIKSSSVEQLWEDKDFVVGAITTFVKQTGNVGMAWQQTIIANPGKSWPATKDLLKAVFGAGMKPLQNALKSFVKTMYKGMANIDTQVNLCRYADKLFWCISVVDGLLTAGDIGMILNEVNQSYIYTVFDVTAQGPLLALNPTSATISTPSQEAPFFVKTSGYLPQSLSYEWGPSKYGKFRTGCGSVGNTVKCVGSQTAFYSLAGTSMPNDTNDTFDVKVYDSNQNLLRKLTGTVNFSNVVIDPSSPSVAEGAHRTFSVSLTSGTIPTGTNVAWSLKGCGTIVTGSLNGVCSVISNSLTVDYVAPMSPVTGYDILDVLLTDASGKTLGSASTQIEVTSAVSLSPVSPSLALGAKQVFTVSAANGFVVPASATYKWTVTGSGTVGGSSTTTTTTPTVTYTAPSSSTVDTLTVHVIYLGNAIAQTSQKISVGVVTWKGSSASVTNEMTFPIYSTSQVTLYEYFVDATHVYYEGTSIDDTASTYSWYCGTASAPLTVTDNGNGSDTIVITDGIPLQNTNGPHCYTTMPGPINLIRTPTKLYFPGSTYTWSQACDYAVTRDFAFSLDKQ